MEAAKETDSPVIIQASRGARKYTNDVFLRNLMQAAVELYPNIPICMHQDHGNSPETCASAIKYGFTSVMMDGSLMADGKSHSSFEYNSGVTKEVVDLAHSKGVSVEGELGCLGNLETGMGDKEDGHGAEGKMTRDQLLTNPEEALAFVKATGVDALAVAIGHQPRRIQILAQARRARFWPWTASRKFTKSSRTRIWSCTVPAACRRNCRTSSTTPAATSSRRGAFRSKKFSSASSTACAKINVDTDLRMAMTGAIRTFYKNEPEKFDPREYLVPARAAMQAVCKARMVAFGQAGNAGKIKCKPLSEMIAYYK